MLLGVVLAQILIASSVLSNPASPKWHDCFSDNDSVSQKWTINAVYAQVIQDVQNSVHLNLTVLGEAPQEIQGFSNSSSNLATLFTSTTVLTLSAWSNSSYLCSPLRPPSPLPVLDNSTATYCPIPAGPVAFSASIPWGSQRELTTLVTRLRAVDPFSNELVCLEVETTPLDPSPGSPYGIADTVFWASVALAIAYWMVVGTARMVSAWNRGNTRPGPGIWSRAQSAGFILASAISGERMTASPALMRFTTPSMRDIILHTQWCATLGMVAVQWPSFAYPLLSQTAWSMLTYNITLTPSTQHWDPFSTAAYNPPSSFADQLADPSSSLYIDPAAPNTLFTLPDDSKSGLESFIYTVGLRPQDAFGICLIIFLGIVAGTIALSSFVWLLDRLASLISGSISPGFSSRALGTRSPAYASKDVLDTPAIAAVEESKSLNGRETPGLSRPASRFGLSLPGGGQRKPWFRKFRHGIGSFHGSVLHGNLVRILILFHLPITIFSVYEMTLPRGRMPTSTTALAALSFTIISVLIPAALLLRVRLTTTKKLYDETRTLLSLGPLYNHYRQGSQMFSGLFFLTNLVTGITVGAGQRSGTAQAIVILVVEVASALVTSIWLPWGTGASMGLLSFLFCVARIVMAVLLVILTPAISIGSGPGGWVAYGILVILALVYLGFLLLLAVKLLEAIVRVVGRISFEKSSNPLDSGLLGACGLGGCCGRRARRRRRGHSKSPRPSSKGQYRTPEGKSKRDSDMSSYLPPISPGNALGQESRKGSIHSGPPPSVLRPEHALQPYREEKDDENGFIMGAWQPFSSKPGYAPVNDRGATSPTTKKAASGFSRVGGGRAHMDSPYAITPSSTERFPSLGHQQEASGSTTGKATLSSATVTSKQFEDETLSVSSNPAHRQHTSSGSNMGLPPGAMAPFHIRTKSQSAIIEHAGSPALGSSPPTRVKLDPPTSYRHPSNASGGDSGSDQSQRKKKPWYQFRRHRPHSSEGSTNPPDNNTELDEFGALDLGGGSSSTQGRSFVVIRKGQSSSGLSQQPGNPRTSAPLTPSQNQFSRDSTGDPSAPSP